MSSDDAGSQGIASDLAAGAYALVQAQPREALALGERALAAAKAEGDPRAQVAALYAVGWAQSVLGDPRSLATVGAGIRIASRHGDARSVGMLRRLRAMLLSLAGKSAAAQREIDAALALLAGIDLARSQVHRVEIHRRSQSADGEAYRRLSTDVTRALRTLRRAGDEGWEAPLRFNRGMLLLERGDLDAAERDFRRAEQLYRRLGAEAGVRDSLVGLANVARLRGDLLECLSVLELVESSLPAGQFNNNLEESRATALAQARLLPEARAAAEAYLEQAPRRGFADEAAVAMLHVASIALLASDADTARRTAAAAARSFAARGHHVNAAIARTLYLRARLLDGSVHRPAVRSGVDAAAVLERAGRGRDALRTRLVVARLGLEAGRLALARDQLERARRLARTGTVTDRIELCHARALLRAAEGDRAGAERLLAAGLRQLDDYRAALGAVELRVTASAIGSDLSRTGLRLAAKAGDAARILFWTERLRSNAMLLPHVRPPSDPALRSLQSELRAIALQLREAEQHGLVVPGAASRQARLEAAIRARMRLIEGDRPGRTSVAGRSEAARRLGERALVEYVELDGELSALTLADGRLVLHRLEAETVAAELEWLRFALGRLARGGDRAQREASAANAQASAAALDRVLVEPLLAALGRGPLVVVPTGALHAVPWSALPSLRGRTLTTAPSLTVWVGLASRARSRRRTAALVAGPRLRHAGDEIRAVGAILPDAAVLRGRAATARATLAALDGAALGHVACHGRFRADSPLFSSLELADGPLTVYELQRLRRAPELVVLSACDLALSDRHAGDELLGLAAALLGMGTRTIVASVVPVPDAEAKRTMLAFHRRLAAGETPASALAAAQARSRVPGFVCLGTG